MSKKDILSALDMALAETQSDGPPEPGEFTLNEFLEKKKQAGDIISRAHAERQLKDLINLGKLSVRKGRVNLRQANIYGPPK